jgi:hypothetical protein
MADKVGVRWKGQRIELEGKDQLAKSLAQGLELAAVNWAEGASEKTVVEGKPSNTDSVVTNCTALL